VLLHAGIRVLTVTLGLLAALGFGAADFFGGLAAKRLHAIAVTGGVAVVGLVVLATVSLAMRDQWSAESLLFGGLSGLSGLAAIGLLYACLARGPMSILSPTTALLSAVIPMTWGLATGNGLSPWAYPALGLVLIAVVLVGFVPDRTAVKPTASALLMAIGSGLLIGAFYILIDLTPDDSGITPLVANRMVQTLLVGIIMVVLLARRKVGSLHRDRSVPLRTIWLMMIAGGVLDALSNVAVLTGFRVGNMAIVSVLTALYPAGTIALASLVLRERIKPVQWVGLALALIASGMLAL
jgi:drug/metabolite transporter (DMT)-like permease